MNVEVTPLPGIGVRKDFPTRAGRRIGVVSHRDGHIELIVSKSDDPDACAASIPLSVDEAAALANLLGAPQLVAKLQRGAPRSARHQHQAAADRPDSPYDGRTLGDTAMRPAPGCPWSR